jgi:hypothetical protein
MSHAQGQSARDAGPDAPAGTADAPTDERTGTAGTPDTTGTAGTQPGDVTQQDPATRQYVPRPARSFDDTSAAEPRPAGAVLGFTITAAVLMMVSGLWNFLEGIAAIIRGTFFVVLPNYVYNISATSWGWFHLILGAVVFVAGAALFMDKVWARVVGIALASLSAVVNFLYIPYSPVWSVIIIALDVFIVWALLAPRTRYTD